MSIGRREFLAGLGGFGAGVGLGAVSHWLPLPAPQLTPAWSPGREESIPSTCMLCPAHCGIRGRVVDGKLVRIDGNPLHPVSRGGLCPKGLAGIQLLYHPGRLTGPVERIGPAGSSDFRRISWKDALDRVGKSLAELRARGEARSTVWLAGHVTGIMSDLLGRFTRAYGTPNLLREDYEDGSARVMQLTQGIDHPPAFDLESSDLIMSFGAALSEAWWCPAQAAQARNPRVGTRPRFVQIDVRHSRTAARADEWVPVRPGTHGALALGIAYVILKEGLYDIQAGRDKVTGIEDWRDEEGKIVPGFRSLVLRHGRTEDISERTGVPTETLVRLAKAFGTAQRPMALWDHAVSWRTGGLSDALAIHALNVLVGAPGRPGGMLIQPPLPVPSLDGHPPDDWPAESAPGDPARFTTADWASRIVAEERSPAQAFFMYYANPVASAANGELAARALERVPLVVSFSPFLDESAKHAHLVLPDHVYLERWQDAPAPPTVPISVWGLVQPLVPPLHETRATGDVVLEIASRLGGDVAQRLPWSKVEDLVQARGKALASARRGGALDGEFRRGELRELEARGWWIPHGLSEDEFWNLLRERGGWFDPYYDYNDRSAVSQLPDGGLRVFPPEARAEITRSAGDLVEGFLPLKKTDGVSAEQGTDEYPLTLVPFRVMTLASGSTALMPWLLENIGVLSGDRWETWAEIHPGTGRRLGLSAGQIVRIESPAGSVRARLRFFQGAQPDVVNVPYGLHTNVEGWGRSEGSNPLIVVGDRRDPVTNLPDWYSSRVRVIPV